SRPWPMPGRDRWEDSSRRASPSASANRATSPRRSRRWPSGSPSASARSPPGSSRSEEHTSELQSRFDLVCRLLLEKKKLQSILSFRIQGVEFANGDMYLAGHQAASAVISEFVSFT